jgi:cytochrome c oxidase subunit 2
LFAVLTALAAAGLSATAVADQPRPWQLGLQEAATPVMERISNFHDALLVVITLITAFVLLLLLYVIVRFHEKRNPTPSRTSHNTVLEVVWTAVPVILLIGIAIPSVRLIYYADRTEEAEMTIKAIGHQWYWSYEIRIKFHLRCAAGAGRRVTGRAALAAGDRHDGRAAGRYHGPLLTTADVLHA